MPRIEHTVGTMSTMPTGSSILLPFLEPGEPEDQWDPDRALVDEVAVVELAVLAEHLPVIAGDDDQGRVVQAQILQTLDDASNTVVGVSDLAGIGTRPGIAMRRALEARSGCGDRSSAGRERTARSCASPATPGRGGWSPHRGAHSRSASRRVFRTGPDRSGSPGRARTGNPERRQLTMAPVVKPLRAEYLGQRLVRVPQLVVEVVANAVTRRDGAGQHRAVSRQRHRNRGIGVREDDALLGDPVDVRGDAAGIAVAAEVVGPAGVDADQEDVANPLGGGRAGEEKPARAAGGHQEQGPESRPTSGNGPAPVALVSHASQSGISAYSTSIVDPPAGMWSRSNTMELMLASYCQPVVVRMPST